ncbi:MAG TPA: PrsW family intramembrane metalloprotease [Pyrinomonadaceae bacterium]|nr:PrsW family intramembrane metalloprotease [Pyrinomonadaceae bacterium]
MRNYGGAYPPQGYVLRARANSQAIKWTLIVIGIFFALLAGFLTLHVIGYATEPAALAVGILFATLPVPIYVLLILWIDRYESEPLWMLATAFFWGATFAAFIAIVVNSLIGRLLTEAYDLLTGKFYALVVSAPIVEELSKGLVLFALFWWKKDEFDGIIDGIVYAGMVGLGFAMTENFQYYGEAAMIGGDRLTGTFILRGAISPFAHPLFTAMTGIGLGWACQSHSRTVKASMPVLGLLAAMLLHFFWNRSAMSGAAAFFVVYGLIMVPIFVAAIIAIIFALRREGRIVSYHLWHDCQRGLFTPEEYYQLCSVRGRMGASFRALTSGGFGLWRTRMRYNQMASELAFHRSRVHRGMIGDPHTALEREMAFVQHLSELRRRLGRF